MKKKFLALILAGVMCFSSSVAMAYTDNSEIFGGTATFKGKITSMTTFSASTSLSDNADVSNRNTTVKADVYTYLASGECVRVGIASSEGGRSCSVNENSSGLPPAGTYAVKIIDVIHTLKENGNTVLTHTRSESV